MTNVPRKTCTKCGIEKDATLDNFHKHDGCRFGVISTCKVCRSRIAKERREANYEIQRAREKYRESLIPKEVIKERDRKFKEKNPEYHKEYSKQHYKDNIEQYKANKKKFEENNPDYQREYAKQYRKQNIEKIREQNRLYRLNNIEQFRERDRVYKKLKANNNPSFRLTECVRSSINRSLQSVNCIGTMRYLDYTIEDLRYNIESKFLEGMSWNNQGDWHIDHIIPISYFNYDSPKHPEFIFCWSLFNLRPLWAEDNMHKNNKLDYDEQQDSLLELLELVREETRNYRSYNEQSA